MTKFWPILLLLAGCGGQNPAEGEEESAEVRPPAIDLPAVAAGEDPAKLQEAVRRAMAAALPGAASARYQNIRAGVGGAVCGDVATGPGPFRPFVITPDTLAVVAPGPAIAFDDPSDFFADAWIRWCATPEELERIGPQLRQAAARPAAPAEEPASPPPLDLPPPEPAPRPAPKPKPPADPPRIDSFFNSVQRE